MSESDDIQHRQHLADYAWGFCQSMGVKNLVSASQGTLLHLRPVGPAEEVGGGRVTVLVVLNKPKFGDPCNRCGECCRQSLCMVADLYFGDVAAPCPALELDGEQFICGLIRRPDHYIELQWGTAEEREELRSKYLRGPVEQLLGIGQGCGMPDEVEA